METPYRLVVISAEHTFENELGAVIQLFKNGLQLFHLRKPHWDFAAQFNFLSALPVEFHSRIVLHANFQLTRNFRLKGIHLNEENRKSAEVYKQYKIVSTSFHSLDELQANNFPYEYVFLSPVFDSISKPGYGSQFALSDLQPALLAHQAPPQVIALGGVGPANIRLVGRAGFSGAALLGAIWQSPDPVQAFKEIRYLTGQIV